MKTIYLFLLPALLCRLEAFGKLAETDAWTRLSQNTIRLGSFKPPVENPGRKTLVLEMPFGKAEWLGSPSQKIPDGAIIETVQLISTQCVLNPGFAQTELDKERIHRLSLDFPAAFENELTQWQRIVESDSTPQKLFHGFVIVYREPQTEKTMAEEISFLDQLFPSQRNEVEAKYVFDGIKTRPIMPGEILTNEAMPGKPAPALPAHPSLPDSTVTDVLTRNTQWKNMLVVCDVTASMSPYNAQVLAWFKNSIGKRNVEHFVFFNDGDKMENKLKRVGSTGGIYDAPALVFDTVFATMKHAMRSGGGGDTPENDVEALDYGITNFGNTGDVILIADNLATPRDLSLAKKITRPVHVILCGANGGINPAYLDLAWQTGGSVHTEDQDVNAISSVKEGGIISIGAFQYKLSGGHFARL